MSRIFTFFSFLMLCSCVTAPKKLKPSFTIVKEAKVHEVFAVSHGKHTGLIVDGASLNKFMPELERRFGQPMYYEIGWGDAGFYQSPKITSGLAVSAVFWPTPTVMHVVALDEHPRDAFPFSEVIGLKISATGLDTLHRFLGSSFARRADDAVLPLGQGIYGNSAFYEGVGHYYLLNTCNKWTAKGLYSAGLKVDAVTPISSGDVMAQIRVGQ